MILDTSLTRVNIKFMHCRHFEYAITPVALQVAVHLEVLLEVRLLGVHLAVHLEARLVMLGVHLEGLLEGS